jgi:hypothetical protein
MLKKDAVTEGTACGTYWHEADARAVIETWRQSGETLAAFARRRGLNRRRLVRWVSRLRASEPAPMQFHPVRVTGEDTSGRRAAAIEIDLGPRRRVRVTPGFATEDLRRVLAVLEEVTPC